MYQQPPGGQPPQQPIPGYVPPQPQAPPPSGNKWLGPVLMGCGALVVVVLIIGGVATYFISRAVGGALHNAQQIARVAQGAAQQAGGEAGQGGTPNPLAVLKGLVGAGNATKQTLSRDELKGYLPSSVGSLARTEAESSTGTVAGITGTNATANYGGADGSVQIQLVDAVNMTGLTTIMDMFMGAVSSDNDQGYEKGAQLGDIKVHEKWTNAGKHAEIIGVVGGRFVINVTSSGVEMSTAEQAFQAVNIAGLTSVASQPAPAATP